MRVRRDRPGARRVPASRRYAARMRAWPAWPARPRVCRARSASPGTAVPVAPARRRRAPPGIAYGRRRWARSGRRRRGRMCCSGGRWWRPGPAALRTRRRARVRARDPWPPPLLAAGAAQRAEYKAGSLTAPGPRRSLVSVITRRFVGAAALALAASAPPLAISGQATPERPARVQALKIQILSTMLADDGIGEWGFAAIVEVDGRRILFDTGARPGTVLENARELKVDLTQVPEVVISHNHGDHTGGLLALRKDVAARAPKRPRPRPRGAGPLLEPAARGRCGSRTSRSRRARTTRPPASPSSSTTDRSRSSPGCG